MSHPTEFAVCQCCLRLLGHFDGGVMKEWQILGDLPTTFGCDHPRIKRIRTQFSYVGDKEEV